MSATAASYPELRGRGVLISGGGSGIGAALVEAFARQGARVAFVDIAEDESMALVDRLAAAVSHRPLFLKADIRDIEAYRSAIAAASAAIGPVRVLVNNAARDSRHDLAEVTPDYWDENQAVNLRHVFFAIQAVAPAMRQAGGGSIINVSSIAFMLNMGEVPAYAAAKAGIIGLTKSLAGKLGPDNIRVNAILPGMVLTDRQLRLWLDEEAIAAMLKEQCLKRSLTAGDISGPCLFLASDASSAMTAQSMIIDGGVF
ncbi:NAD(P)-dependent dehydrogenase (short-subunit alcohol dehydrogenase family) [Mycoplana sp. BE70]|uniref:SDR family NAD(P)-dependent oxidoreductase n=1 Tax=Mycoplana sp. BE70 TaxID=2817775 RepID=UPI0028573FB4|nr:SDR family oxidoreductase [Mycoplana sp. BE70]MDR6756215.1 NAD(P)-dependent dehydrogenase (short-subunit alcohol dehydrogenase family) [Mycoplana sp. BE70]